MTVRVELSLRLLNRHRPFLTHRIPTRPDLAEPILVPLLAPIGRLERFAELLLLHRLELAEVRGQGRTEVRVQREAEELTFGSDRLVGVGKDFRQGLEDRFDVDGFRAEAAVRIARRLEKDLSSREEGEPGLTGPPP